MQAVGREIMGGAQSKLQCAEQEGSQAGVEELCKRSRCSLYLHRG